MGRGQIRGHSGPTPGSLCATIDLREFARYFSRVPAATPPIVLSAEQFVRQIGRGQTRPLVVRARDLNGTVRTVAMKMLYPVPELPFQGPLLMRELVAALAGRQLGLPVPEPALVKISDQFASSTADQDVGAVIQQSRGMAFGSRLIEPSLDTESSRWEGWRNICGFDAHFFNGDRKAANPNVVFDGQTIWMIDHQLIAYTKAFDDGGFPDTLLWGKELLDSHASYPPLRGHGVLYDELRFDWASILSPSFIDWAIDQVPQEWADQPARDRLRRFLHARSTMTAAQADELEDLLR